MSIQNHQSAIVQTLINYDISEDDARKALIPLLPFMKQAEAGHIHLIPKGEVDTEALEGTLKKHPVRRRIQIEIRRGTSQVQLGNCTPSEDLERTGVKYLTPGELKDEIEFRNIAYGHLHIRVDRPKVNNPVFGQSYWRHPTDECLVSDDIVARFWKHWRQLGSHETQGQEKRGQDIVTVTRDHLSSPHRQAVIIYGDSDDVPKSYHHVLEGHNMTLFILGIRYFHAIIDGEEDIRDEIAEFFTNVLRQVFLIGFNPKTKLWIVCTG